MSKKNSKFQFNKINGFIERATELLLEDGIDNRFRRGRALEIAKILKDQFKQKLIGVSIKRIRDYLCNLKNDIKNRNTADIIDNTNVTGMSFNTDFNGRVSVSLNDGIITIKHRESGAQFSASINGGMQFATK